MYENISSVSSQRSVFMKKSTQNMDTETENKPTKKQNKNKYWEWVTSFELVASGVP